MQVINIWPSRSEIIETNEEGWSTYRRYGNDSWEQLMGESWEQLYSCEHLEAAYQVAKRQGIGE